MWFVLCFFAVWNGQRINPACPMVSTLSPSACPGGLGGPQPTEMTESNLWALTPSLLLPQQNTQRLGVSQATHSLTTPVVSVATPSLLTQGLPFSAMPTAYNTGKTWPGQSSQVGQLTQEGNVLLQAPAWCSPNSCSDARGAHHCKTWLTPKVPQD